MRDGRVRAEPETVPPTSGLFRMGEAAAGGEGWRRWGGSFLVAALAHAGLMAVALTASGARARTAERQEEPPELVFLRYAPPPAAAGGPVKSQAPAQVTPRQARPRPTPIKVPAVVPTKAPEPVEAPPEEKPEPVAEVAEAPPAQTPAVASTQGGPGVEGGVVGGVVGGAVGGREGGALGAIGGEALTLKQVSRAPTVLKQVTPDYPRRAREDGIAGLVLVRVIIGTDGRVEPEHTRIMRSVPALDAAAIEAVTQWRFSPALGREGRPVRVIVDVPVQFSLR